MAKSWIVPTFGVFIAWAMWSFIPKITVRYIDPASAVIYEVVGGIAVAAVALIWLDFRVAFHWKGAALAMVAGVLGFLGGFLFLVAVKRGPVSLVATVSALYPVLTIAIAVVFLGETINLRQGIGILFALIAMALIAA